MKIQQLRYARALAECGSFVQAADQCGVTQPTLSNGIAQLEYNLGHQLFARTTRTVRLTAAGHHLLPDIADILNAQAALLARARTFSHSEQKVMRIGVSPIISVKFVALVIEPFRQDNPDIEVIFREMNLSEMMTSLEKMQLDFMFGPAGAISSGEQIFDSVAFHAEPLVFIPSRSTKANYARAKSVSLKEICDETFVMVPDTCGLTRTTRALFQERSLKLHEYSGKAMSYAVLQEWAELGIGSAILPRSKLEEGQSDEILIVDGMTPYRILYRSVWRGGPNTTAEVQSLAKFLNEVAPSIIQGLAR